MPMRIVAATLVLFAAIGLAACAPPRSEAEQTYRDWMRAVDDFRRRTVADDTVATLRERSSADMMHALQWHLSGYVDSGYRQTGYRHVAAFRFLQAPPTVGPAHPDTRITAEVCVDASLVGQLDAHGHRVELRGPLRYERLVEFTTDGSGRLRVHQDAKTDSDVCD
ncbi:hypothetical protein [Microbacterium sp.]|uniref:hypothetical protein n=1 Tax=Microbacterium sp. TaxID=51671 RepID=UPI002810EF3C|nr:hypothetical protein [Microbacterium sp.]